MKHINTKYQFLLGLLVIITLNVCGQNQITQNIKQHLIITLEKAESSAKIDLIESIYSEDAVIYTTELMPIKGKTGIISLYNLIFSRQDVEYVKYQVDTTYIIDNKRIEIGRNIGKRINQPADTNKFKAVFQQFGDTYKITEMSFGDEEKLKHEILKLLKPTGKYQVGQATYFFDKIKSDNDRLLAFQVWYPSQTESTERAKFRSREVVEASADFFKIPLFAISYFSLIESNSFLNSPVFPDKTFPVLLYNHGYGGFTSVYQTVFEDLASNGYIVVSIAHQNESALFIKEDGEVIRNSPENEIYKSRASELNGTKINGYQSVILNNDDLQENQEAYEELIKLSPLHNESTRLWQSDTKAVFEKLKELNKTDTNLKGAFDFENIGAIGHSVGGATAGQLGFENDFIKAGINLDGFQFGDLINNHLKIPFMFISSNQEGNRYVRALTFIDKSETDCYQVFIKGFTHDSFTDIKYVLEGETETIELQRELIKSFFDKYLKNENINLKEIESKYDNLTLIEK